MIPIHSKLIDLNLLGYAKNLRKGCHVRLFPELVRGRDGYGQVPSKWYGRFRDRLGWQPQKPNLDFHSFRHTVANALKQSGQQQAHISALLGHLQESVTIGIYGDNFNTIAAPRTAVIEGTTPSGKPTRIIPLYNFNRDFGSADTDIDRIAIHSSQFVPRSSGHSPGHWSGQLPCPANLGMRDVSG